MSAPESTGDHGLFEPVMSQKEIDPNVAEAGHSSDESSDLDHDSYDATKLSPMRKIHIVVAGFTCTFHSNLGSSMPSGAIDAIAEHFDVKQDAHLTLLNSLYMVGYVISPLIVGPLSEYVGRRPVLLGTFLGYIIFMFACSGAPNYTALLVFRFLCGMNAAAPTTVISGLYADIYDEPSTRGNALALYMSVTTLGPYFGPVISGFASTVGWRWPFWIAGIFASVSLPIVLTIPETYAPVLYNKAVRKYQRMHRDSNSAGTMIQPKPFNARKIFLRPMVLLFTEPILASTAAYLTLAYGLLYIFFQAYPIVFQEMYGLSPGMASLAHIPSAVGTVISFVIFVWFTRYHDQQTKAGAKWTKKEIYRRLPLSCLGSPCLVIALFWFGWTSWPSISPIVPSLCGIFFGIGYQLLFLGMANYLTDIYRQSSASAQGAAAMTRSIGAVVLPLSTDRLYRDLGVHWAPSILGFIALAMGVIPFIFIKFGERLARSSKAAREVYKIEEEEVAAKP